MKTKNLFCKVIGIGKKVLPFYLFTFLPLSMLAQDDDMYFVPSKESKAQDAYQYGMPSKTYYSGSSRSTDEYNRRMIGVIPSDSTGNDIIDFSAVRGVYPDSVAPAEQSEDYQLTRRMSRFDDYTPSQAYWDGYRDGRWSSPWYYNSWYSWYDYDPWYWNSPYYYSWYSPWYYGWSSPWYYGYYRPWNYGWGYPYYYGGPIYTGRISTHQGRHTSNVTARPVRNTTRTVRTTTTNRTTYDNNRSFDTSRSSSISSGSFGGSRSSGGSFGGGGGAGGGRSVSGGRSFGGRR